jgi:hypothetical protein
MRNALWAMAMPCRGFFSATSAFFLFLFSLVILVETPAQAQQWTGPDASSNIYNANAAAGAVIVQSTTSNGGQKFVVNPLGAGGITLGAPNTGSGGYTSLLFAISAYQNGYSTIQSVQSAGSAYGVLGLNVGGGNVGIGTTTPQAPLEVKGSVLGTTSGNTLEMTRVSALSGNYSQLRFLLNRFAAGSSWLTASTRIQAWTDVTGQGYIDFNPNGSLDALAFGSSTSEMMRILSSGQVLIGKTAQANSSYLLDVNGNGRLNEVVVNTTGADFVFDSAYRLSPLRDVENYVIKEHHLPGIAAATQMQQEGVNLGDNQTRLLAKIEELTLYLIRQDKETQALKETIRHLEERNRAFENLEQRIEALEHPNRP